MLTYSLPDFGKEKKCTDRSIWSAAQSGLFLDQLINAEMPKGKKAAALPQNHMSLSAKQEYHRAGQRDQCTNQ